MKEKCSGLLTMVMIIVLSDNVVVAAFTDIKFSSEVKLTQRTEVTM